MRRCAKILTYSVLLGLLGGCVHVYHHDPLTTWAMSVDQWIWETHDSLEAQIGPSRVAICRGFEELSKAQSDGLLPDSLNFSLPSFCGPHADNSEIPDPPCPITNPGCRRGG